MAKPKKDGKYLNSYISRNVVEALDYYSKKTGISKAFVIENALKDYFFKYSISRNNGRESLINTEEQFQNPKELG